MDSLRNIIDATIENVWNQMCEDYCRYPREWDEEKEGVELYESEICANCPMNKL